jgi:hypothetical protein
MSKRQLALVGRRFGKWTVVRYHDFRSANHRWLCRCDCGREQVVWQHSLTQGRSTRCRRCVRPWIKHGHWRNGSASRTLGSYRHMLGRCYDPRNKAWPAYGGMGIKVCKRWRGPDGFANFLADMGERPKDKTIDRYPDSNGNYEPGNCRWATWPQQLQNRRGWGRVGLKGVHQDRSGNYRARIRYGDKQRLLGTFCHAEEGHQAYRDAARKHYGRFANMGLSDEAWGRRWRWFICSRIWIEP